MRRNDKFVKFMLMLGIIGALNWGLIGFFNWNLVDALFGGGAREETSGFARLIYALVGLGGLAALFAFPRLHLTERHHVTAGRTP